MSYISNVEHSLLRIITVDKLKLCLCFLLLLSLLFGVRASGLEVSGPSNGSSILCGRVRFLMNLDEEKDSTFTFHLVGKSGRIDTSVVIKQGFRGDFYLPSDTYEWKVVFTFGGEEYLPCSSFSIKSVTLEDVLEKFERIPKTHNSYSVINPSPNVNIEHIESNTSKSDISYNYSNEFKYSVGKQSNIMIQTWKTSLSNNLEIIDHENSWGNGHDDTLSPGDASYSQVVWSLLTRLSDSCLEVPEVAIELIKLAITYSLNLEHETLIHSSELSKGASNTVLVKSDVLTLSGMNGIKNITVVSLLGRLINHYKYSSGESTISIPINQLSPGIYFLKTESQLGSCSYKFIVQ